MVRNYVKTTTRQSWDPEQMQAADEVLSTGKSVKSIALDYQVPRATLQRYVEKQKKDASKELIFDRAGAFKNVFSHEQEEAIYKVIVNMQDRMIGFTGKDIRRLAYQVAKKFELSHPFNQEFGLAGYDWLQSFMKKFKLSFRKTEHTSMARTKGFNKYDVDGFFDLLDDVLKKYKFTAADIFNVDESGVTVNPKTSATVIAQKGQKQIPGLSSAERGETITTEICFSASGQFMPPMYVIPRVRENAEFTQDLFPGAWAEFHKSGWMQHDIFAKWFKKFIEFSKATPQTPRLLILDGHVTYVKNLDIINLANENGVIAMCFPPHTTHKMQPADVSFMKPLSMFYMEEVSKWLRAHPGKIITLKKVPYLHSQAFMRAAKTETAIKAFEKTGIWPFNRNCFDKEFAKALEPTLEKNTESQPESVQKVVENLILNNNYQPTQLEGGRTVSNSEGGDAIVRCLSNLPSSSIELHSESSVLGVSNKAEKDASNSRKNIKSAREDGTVSASSSASLNLNSNAETSNADKVLDENNNKSNSNVKKDFAAKKVNEKKEGRRRGRPPKSANSKTPKINNPDRKVDETRLNIIEKKTIVSINLNQTPVLQENVTKVHQSNSEVKKRSRKGKAAVITDPDYKNELVAELQNQKPKNPKQTKVKAVKKSANATFVPSTPYNPPIANNATFIPSMPYNFPIGNNATFVPSTPYSPAVANNATFFPPARYPPFFYPPNQFPTVPIKDKPSTVLRSQDVIGNDIKTNPAAFAPFTLPFHMPFFSPDSMPEPQHAQVYPSTAFSFYPGLNESK